MNARPPNDPRCNRALHPSALVLHPSLGRSISIVCLALWTFSAACGAVQHPPTLAVVDPPSALHSPMREAMERALRAHVHADSAVALEALTGLEAADRDSQAAALLLLLRMCLDDRSVCGEVDVRASAYRASADPLVRLLQVCLAEELDSVLRAPWEQAIVSRPSLGRPDRWRVAGPFDEVDYGQSLEPEREDALAASYTFEGGEVLSRLQPVDAGLFPMGEEGAGVWFAETFLDVQSPGEWLIAAWSWEPYSLRLAGVPVLRRTHADRWRGTIAAVTVDLQPGVHRVLLRREVTGSERSAWVSLVPLDASHEVRFLAPTAEIPPNSAAASAPRITRAASTVEDAFAPWIEEGLSTVEGTIAALAATWASSADAAIAMLQRAEEPVSPLQAWAHVSLLAATESLPPSERQADAISLAGASVQRWPEAHTLRQLWLHAMQRSDQRDRALGVARAAVELRPDYAPTIITLVRLLESMGWQDAAVPWREVLAAQVPPDCVSVSVLLSRRTASGLPTRASDIPHEWTWCARGWEAWMEARLRDGESPEELRDEALARMHASAGERIGALLFALRAEARIDPTGENAARILRDPLAPRIAETSRVIASLDVRELTDDEVTSELETFLRRHPASLEARLFASLFSGERMLGDMRIDGAAAVATWQADNEEVGPQGGTAVIGDIVYILDYGATRFFPDGAGFELVHQIVQLRTRDAVGSHGEVGVPNDAYLLTVRTLKADGRALVPMDIAGKDSISLPSLEVGDFVELEFVRPFRSTSIRRASSLLGRFYFRVPDAAMARTLAVYEFPSAWQDKVVVDLRHFSGDVRRSEIDGRIRLEYELRAVPPTPIAGMAPPIAEWVPSVRVAVDWSVEARTALYDQLVRRQVTPDRQTEQFVDRVLGALPSNAAHRDRVRALFRAINDQPDFSGFFSSPGAHFFSEMQGERRTALFAALIAAGYQPELIAIRTREADASASEIFDESEFDLVAVRVSVNDEEFWMEPDFDTYPFDYLRSEAQAQPAVVLSGPRRGQMFSTPLWPEEGERNTVILDVHLSGPGEARVECYEVMTRRASANWRSFLDRTDDRRDIRDQFERVLAQQFGSVQFESFDFEGLDAPDEPLVLRYRFQASGLTRLDPQGRLVLESEFFEKQLDRAFARDAERSVPLLISVPIHDHTTVRIHTPGRELVDPLPDPIVATLGDAAFERQFSYHDDAVMMVRTTSLPAGRYGPEAYPALRGFLREASRDGRVRLVFR
jgi:hypothetical protein